MAVSPTLSCRRRDRVEFERAAAVRNGLGVIEAGTWSALGSRMVRISWGTSAERRANAVEGAIQSATLRLLADSLTRMLTEEDRARLAGRLWDITGIVPARGESGRAEFEITITAAKG